MGFFDFLRAGRRSELDGSSPELAIVVNNVMEEYDWILINCDGFEPVMQEMREIAGKPYDCHSLQNGDGEERVVYFDISRFF